MRGGSRITAAGGFCIRLLEVVSLRLPRFSSGIWFFYEASRDLAYLGIAVAAVFTAIAAVQQTIPKKVAVLMAWSTLAAIALLWHALHGYPNPGS